MADIPRLNGVIRALEAGKPAFTSFCQADPETAIAMSTAKYDGIVYEMEHNPWDIRALRDSLQYMLNRGQIAKSGSVAPAVTPMVRVPPNGAEKAQFQAKQALDLGVYGIVWPHISTVDEAYNAVASFGDPRVDSESVERILKPRDTFLTAGAAGADGALDTALKPAARAQGAVSRAGPSTRWCAADPGSSRCRWSTTALLAGAPLRAKPR